MITTEEQAKNKECHQWLAKGEYSRMDGKYHSDSHKPPCTASRCMAWRWIISVDGNKKHGFCGIAGKPMEAV